MLQRILVWDIPTRVFHWSLALSFAGAYLTAESERYRDIHLALGYTLLGLIVFLMGQPLLGGRAEPPDPANPLFKLPNLIASPHIAGVTAEAMERMSAEAAQREARGAAEIERRVDAAFKQEIAAQPSAAPSRSIAYSRPMRSVCEAKILASATPAATNGKNNVVHTRASFRSSSTTSPHAPPCVIFITMRNRFSGMVAIRK